ncbi:hypothetical protein C3B78_15655 [Arthrobacter sp. PGP41]|uniref:hypothetical protein n=1 Tax=unclassified Arthrobacter TaxID=235627 RepID=UPI000CDC6187|nr:MULTISPECIES: hypothetical protein [unclassified Arthrobacter]AUZ35740.1 hypothetical protein C3B78_15655 [Arthrobacter sp. PGP41]MDT0193828.1 hypothetical protein [Arthrobacter sp. AB6]
MDFTRRPSAPVYAGQEVAFRFELEGWEKPGDYDFQIIDERGRTVPMGGSKGGVVTKLMGPGKDFEPTVMLSDSGEYRVRVRSHVLRGKPARWSVLDTINVEPPESAPVLKVALQTDAAPNSGHKDLWGFIGGVASNLKFGNFARFAKAKGASLGTKPPFGSMTYDILHALSKEFVTEGALGNMYPSSGKKSAWGPGKLSGTAIPLSYVTDQRNVPYKPFPTGIPRGQYPLELVPFVELIYVYWLEEAMLFQSLNRIIARFQNRRAPGGRDPLSRLAVNPLMPLRGLLWGLAEAEDERLSLRRRAAEYEYQYGLQLIGRAVPPAELLVERRTQFLEAFHSLLNACHHYYKELNDKTVDADAFPLLSHLQELHLVLAKGANNQFADMALIARIETMDVQWMLAQPEMHQFLGGPTMVPYEEEWMDRVDTMKSMQGWSDVSVTHFYDLAVHGEQLLLSVRHGRWNESTMKSDDAKNWAIAWKSSVQRYIHAYRAVTGVDLSERVDTTMPSTLLQRRLAQKLVRY